jgi:hypothetical protein
MEQPRISWSRLAAGPALAVICMVTGGALAGTALRSESAARAFASVAPTGPYSEAAFDPATPTQAAAEFTPNPQVINLDSMVIAGQATVRAAARQPAACVAGWRELAQGPSGGRVLETCNDGTTHEATTSHTARRAAAERQQVPKVQHDRLIDLSTEKRSVETPLLVIGDPALPSYE